MSTTIKLTKEDIQKGEAVILPDMKNVTEALGINKRCRNEAILSLQLFGIRCKASIFPNDKGRKLWNIAIGSDKFHAAINNQGTWVKESDLGRFIRPKITIDLSFGKLKFRKEIKQGA